MKRKLLLLIKSKIKLKNKNIISTAEAEKIISELQQII